MTDEKTPFKGCNKLIEHGISDDGNVEVEIRCRYDPVLEKYTYCESCKIKQETLAHLKEEVERKGVRENE